MAIEKLNKVFIAQQVLTAKEMNAVSGKIDEVIEEVNNSGGGIEDAPSDGYTYGRSDGKWVKIKTDYDHVLYVLDLTNSSSVADIEEIVGTPQNLIDLSSKYNLYTGLYAYGIKGIPIRVNEGGGSISIECSYIKPASTVLIATRIWLQYKENTWTGCQVETNDN